MKDSMLIAAAREGSEEAFSALHKKYLPCVRAVGRSMLRTNDLDDLCQDTFLLAFTKLGSFKGNSNFRTWVTRIAMNQCLMMLRRNRQVTNGTSQLIQLDGETVSDDFLEQCFFSVEDNNLRSIAARVDLSKYMGDLTPQQREMLEMAYIDGLSDQEIADRMDISLGSVKGRIHNAKKKIRGSYAQINFRPENRI